MLHPKESHSVSFVSYEQVCEVCVVGKWKHFFGSCFFKGSCGLCVACFGSVNMFFVVLIGGK